uniref:RNA-dependent RNA polymerase n=1 Tax=Riboviria sp. TaxID=2585031 RepID=A0A8B0RK42_9VIRU|nr:RNA-dependent RNA polymerase [Riboviria sp.]
MVRRAYDLKRPLPYSLVEAAKPCAHQVKTWKEFTNFLLDLVAHGKSALVRRPGSTPFTRSFTSFIVSRCAWSRGRGKWASIAFSLGQLKRCFPALPDEMRREALDKHQELLGSAAEPFVEFPIVDRIIQQYFPVNWARKTSVKVYNAIPNTACIEGGSCRDYLASTGPKPARGCTPIPSSGQILAKRRYESIFDKLYMQRLQPLPTLKAVAVPDAGKFRIITIDSVSAKCLQPVQRALLSHLSRFPEFEFCTSTFQGELPPKWGKMAKGEKLLSVDYSNATDGVDGSFMSNLMERIIDRSGSFELLALREQAVQETTLGRRISNDLCSFWQRRGTLMGSLVSFPLLCLWNASIIREAGMKKFIVCGDDALAYATNTQKKRWADYSAKLGLVQSPGKTFHSRKFGTFCSKVVGTHHLNAGRILAPMSGENYNRTPKQFRHVYKRYCFYPHGEFRSLYGPREIGGLGGEVDDIDVPSRRALRKAQAHLARQGTKYQLGMLDMQDENHAGIYTTAWSACDPTPQRLTPRLRKGGSLDYRSKPIRWFTRWDRKSRSRRF